MRLSITAKINFFLLFIFSMVLVFSAAYQAVRERDLILTLIKEQSREQTEAYFDGLNMLMLTGKMEARDTLRAKFLDHAHVEDARIVRGAAINKQYGAGRETEAPKDRFDALALAGKGSLEVVHDGTHSKLVLVPLVLTAGAVALGFRGIELGILMLMASSPSAAAGYVMVRAMGGNAALAANIIALTTLGSLLTTSLGVMLLRSGGLI